MKTVKELLTKQQFEVLVRIVGSDQRSLSEMNPDEIYFIQGYVAACILSNKRNQEAAHA